MDIIMKYVFAAVVIGTFIVVFGCVMHRLGYKKAVKDYVEWALK